LGGKRGIRRLSRGVGLAGAAGGKGRARNGWLKGGTAAKAVNLLRARWGWEKRLELRVQGPDAGSDGWKGGIGETAESKG